jgi:hypothetical protein
MRNLAGGSIAGLLFSAACALLSACSRPSEQQKAVEAKQPDERPDETPAEPVRNAKSSKQPGTQRALNPNIPTVTGDARAQNEDYKVALAEIKRLDEEAKFLESRKLRMVADSKIAALAIAFDRKEAAEGFLAAAKWLREQVEGKQASDLSIEPAK